MKDKLQGFIWYLLFTFMTYMLIKLQFVYAIGWMEWLLNNSSHSFLVAIIIVTYISIWYLIYWIYMKKKEKK